MQDIEREDGAQFCVGIHARADGLDAKHDAERLLTRTVSVGLALQHLLRMDLVHISGFDASHHRRNSRWELPKTTPTAVESDAATTIPHLGTAPSTSTTPKNPIREGTMRSIIHEQPTFQLDVHRIIMLLRLPELCRQADGMVESMVPAKNHMAITAKPACAKQLKSGDGLYAAAAIRCIAARGWMSRRTLCETVTKDGKYDYDRMSTVIDVLCEVGVLVATTTIDSVCVGGLPRRGLVAPVHRRGRSSVFAPTSRGLPRRRPLQLETPRVPRPGPHPLNRTR